MAHHVKESAEYLPDKSPSLVDRFASKIVLKLFDGLDHGHLKVITSDGTHDFGEPASDLKATLQIDDPAAFRDIALGGSVGAGEAYGNGLWSTPDLVQLIRLFVKNLTVVDKMERGMARAFTGFMKAVYRLSQQNTKTGSRKNIAAHYDLGNDLFNLFLDETMMYSCAIYPSADATLHEAQVHRLNRIGHKLHLTPDDHLLEIGTGWGGLAIHMAKHFGCRVTTTTISTEQHKHAVALVAKNGLQDKVTVLLKDYRELEGQYDKLVSIEMIEAVGHRFYDNYFETCSTLLKSNGLALIQAILIDDRRFEQAKNEVDFIKSHIFPGSCIPSLGVISDCVRRKTDLSTVHVEDITPHYARTLRDWRERFMAQKRRLNELGYDDRFIRLWEFYFAYCEAGFTERSIRTAQITFAKPDSRQDTILGDVGA